MIIELKNISTTERQSWLQAAIAPRPIALASTINKKGIVNLAPFSFFNLFSADPPILIFSPARRVRDNTRKHTLINIEQVPEVVINLVDEDILRKVNQCSFEYSEDTNEMDVVGFTSVKSMKVNPPCVLESKVNLECKVIEIKPMGINGGAGNLIICEILIMHISEAILNSNKKIDYKNYKPVGRLGGAWYCKTDMFNLFELAKP